MRAANVLVFLNLSFLDGFWRATHWAFWAYISVNFWTEV